jgi:Fe-S-cluster containining protein
MGLVLCTILIDGENGLNVARVSPDATVSDLLKAMQTPADDPLVYKPLHRSRYGVCAGCVYNCCKSNDIPLDLISARAIAFSLGLSLASFAQRFLKLDHTSLFPEFRKRPCPFLNNNLCTIYEQRALICRLYICTPMSETLEKLRSAALLMGEAALRQTLVEQDLGPAAWTEDFLARDLYRQHKQGLISSDRLEEELEMLDMWIHRNPFLEGHGYDTVRLRDCCTETMWKRVVCSW